MRVKSKFHDCDSTGLTQLVIGRAPARFFVVALASLAETTLLFGIKQRARPNMFKSLIHLHHLLSLSSNLYATISKTHLTSQVKLHCHLAETIRAPASLDFLLENSPSYTLLFQHVKAT